MIKNTSNFPSTFKIEIDSEFQGSASAFGEKNKMNKKWKNNNYYYDKKISACDNE